MVDGKGIPLGALIGSATPAEVTLAEQTLKTIRVLRRGGGRPKQKPKRVIPDKGYDSGPLRERMWERGINFISPARNNRLHIFYDGRKLRGYKKCWKIERTFAWLNAFRRLIVRHERYLFIYTAFFHLACVILALRQL